MDFVPVAVYDWHRRHARAHARLLIALDEIDRLMAESESLMVIEPVEVADSAAAGSGLSPSDRGGNGGGTA